MDARAEPNFRRLTAKQLDAQLARPDRKVQAEHAKSVKRQQRDRQRYDPETEAARLALLESLLVELTAPVADPDQRRAPRTLVVVLDRSGSMSSQRLDGAKKALIDLVNRLDPADRFGLVTFDDRVRVEIAAAPLTDKARAKPWIAGIDAGGMTDLSAGRPAAPPTAGWHGPADQ